VPLQLVWRTGSTPSTRCPGGATGVCICSVCVAMCFSVLQYVAVCCSVLQFHTRCPGGATGVCIFGRVLQRLYADAFTMCVLQCVAVCCSVLQCVAATHLTRECLYHVCVAVRCSVLQCVCCRVLQCVVLCCSYTSYT